MKITSLIFCIFLLGSSINSAVGQQLIRPMYELKTSKFIKETVYDETYWVVECVLINRSTDTLNYLSMSCSRTDIYSVDTKQLEIEGFSCDKNFPVILSIAPGETRSEVIRLFKRKEFQNESPGSFKVGLNIIKTQSTLNFEEELKKKNVVWSTSMYLW